MKIAVIASKNDIAGMNVARHLESMSIPVFYTDNEIINAESVDKQVAADFIIFASKHKSQEHNKTLTVHTIGNIKSADYGGRQETLIKSSAFAVKKIFQILCDNAKNTEYECTLEATHHGPYIETPCLFIELGSTEEEWKDNKVAFVIANTINTFISEFPFLAQKNWIPAIGIGGTHYCQNFNKIQLSSDYALSYLIPLYHFPLSDKIIRDAIMKTTENPETVLLDWKGLGKAKERDVLLEIIKTLGLKIIKTSSVGK